MAEQFKWINWYTEFATELLPYKDNRKELIRKIQRVFESIGMKMPKLEKDGEPFDIDPFTIFGLFNKGITEANRIAIIRGIGKEFAVEAEVPETFEGIPVLNNLKATFYFLRMTAGKVTSIISGLFLKRRFDWRIRILQKTGRHFVLPMIVR